MPGMSTNDTTTPTDADAIAARIVEFFDGDTDDAVYAARRSGLPDAVIDAITRRKP